jgi:uncharacterized protein YaiL (DUF2058 family)
LGQSKEIQPNVKDEFLACRCFILSYAFSVVLVKITFYPITFQFIELNMASLQDQLLKAGLSTKQKARQANSATRKKNKQQRSGVQHDTSLQEKVKEDLVQQKNEKIAKDSALNEEKKQQLLVKEKQLRIKQILIHHQLKNIKGDNEYNYTFDNKIKKLALDAQTHKALVNGRLSVCGFEEVSYVVTRETADKLAELDTALILVQNDKSADDIQEDDDPYADYQIPDDMMW